MGAGGSNDDVQFSEKYFHAPPRQIQSASWWARLQANKPDTDVKNAVHKYRARQKLLCKSRAHKVAFKSYTTTVILVPDVSEAPVSCFCFQGTLPCQMAQLQPNGSPTAPDGTR